MDGWMDGATAGKKRAQDEESEEGLYVEYYMQGVGKEVVRDC